VKRPKRPREMHPAELEIWQVLAAACSTVMVAGLKKGLDQPMLYGFIGLFAVGAVVGMTPCHNRWEDR
jgi:uncharacterized membrane protein